MKIEEQNIDALYHQEESGSGNRLPASIREWKQKAENILQKEAFEYIARGSGEEATLRSNRKAFNNWQISHRVLRNVSNRELSISLFGKRISSPLLLAPIGVQTIAHPEGELASARAAADMDIPFITSTAATYSMEEIANEMGDSPRWFQLYNSNNDRVTESMVKRAEACGYSAIVVTVDTPVLGHREFDLQNSYSPLKEGKGNGNYISDPAFCEMLEKSPRKDMKAAIQKQMELFENPSLTWEDIEKIRKYSKLPILLKGIVDPEDAKIALNYVDGLIVSNHGGRQLDHGIASLDALEKICQVIQGEIPVLFDSGIRRGTDVLKAIALGASAVLLGRPFMYGLATGGEAGVKRVIQQIQKELDVSMALSGVRSINEIDSSLLVRQR
ncbi:alpha-hydroxy-acid oxidizing protein [Alkalihalobacillus sp. AL-G]|uniref:alpha-hydroxy-acid oxidizing protein n=1 Tax=Alkalihalobacillus sp. AL-G TaxID=2926399 RepID=UPI00272CB4FE|nr:alpha-hydroxy-acid oxidizing protein [Alkalihalobacillus sp. AL-G]WLD93827.1 alpha-hydroxy-acid oxidizing protein [Alkalihalobacillus sp. AL-G]